MRVLRGSERGERCIATTEPWEAWCSLQEPLLGPDGTYGCVIRGNGASSNQATCTTQDNGKVLGTYPTWKCEMCGVFDGAGACTCDESHCYARKDATLTYGARGPGPTRTDLTRCARIGRVTHLRWGPK